MANGKLERQEWPLVGLRVNGQCSVARSQVAINGHLRIVASIYYHKFANDWNSCAPIFSWCKMRGARVLILHKSKSRFQL